MWADEGHGEPAKSNANHADYTVVSARSGSFTIEPALKFLSCAAEFVHGRLVPGKGRVHGIFALRHGSVREFTSILLSQACVTGRLSREVSVYVERCPRLPFGASLLLLNGA